MSDTPHQNQAEDPSASGAEHGGPPQMSIAALRHGPVILLVGLLMIHAYAVHGHDGDPWRFGGYGMFAVPLTRYVDAKIIDEQGRTHHLSANRIWKPFPRRYNRARTLPDTASLCALAERLAGLRWTAQKASENWRIRDKVTKFNAVTESASEPPVTLEGAWLARRTKDPDASSALSVDRFEVRVAKIVFDRDENHTRRHPLASVVWTKDGVCLPR